MAPAAPAVTRPRSRDAAPLFATLLQTLAEWAAWAQAPGRGRRTAAAPYSASDASASPRSP